MFIALLQLDQHPTSNVKNTMIPVLSHRRMGVHAASFLSARCQLSTAHRVYRDTDFARRIATEAGPGDPFRYEV